MHVPLPRGGQPGNQNARKHGFYSAVFTGQDKINLNQAAEIDGLDEEIALIRARLKSVLSQIGYTTQQIVDLYLGKIQFGGPGNGVTLELSANPDVSK